MKIIQALTLVFVLICADSEAQIIDEYLISGNNHMQQRDYKEALNAYTINIRENPDDAIGYLVRSRVYSVLGREQEGQRDAEIAIGLNPYVGMLYNEHLRVKYMAAKSYAYNLEKNDDAFIIELAAPGFEKENFIIISFYGKFNCLD